MERSAWTDARLDDRFDQIDRRFDRVDREISELRVETRTGLSELRGEIGVLRMDLTGQIDRLRQTSFRMNASLWVGLIGVIAAILARGA